MVPFALIDAHVAATDSLLSGLGERISVINIGAALDGISPFAQTLQGAMDFNVTPIILHGAADMLCICGTTLNQYNLADYRNELARIGASFLAMG